MIKDGIILTGGSGTRLSPITTYLGNKHLAPVYDKFVIDYSLSTLKSIGVENLTVILGGNYFDQIVRYLKDGEHLGFNIKYVFQDKPSGIAQAINLCKGLVNTQFAVVLGDNWFENSMAHINNVPFRARVVLNDHPELNRFGVASIDSNNKIIKIQEKPKLIDLNYKNYAITGCYVFDEEYFDFFKFLKPSARGEFEIVDIIEMYNKTNDLGYCLTNGQWSDLGTHDSILKVANLVSK